MWHQEYEQLEKEIDHILVSTRWRILQSCRVYRSAEFFATDHRLVIASLKIHIEPKKISRCNFPRLNLEKLRDPACAHEYAVAVSNRFGVLDTLEDPEEMWDTFKFGALEPADGILGVRRRFTPGLAR